ncbi:MAG: DUF364 domain-containing protein, partial [Oscillospiraceae bacterium]
MWELYDRIIGGIDDDIIVTNAVIGKVWTAIKAIDKGGNIYGGMCMTVLGHNPNYKIADIAIGKSLREIAQYSKSWNFSEASMGVAAINAFYNTREKALSQNAIVDGLNKNDAFENAKSYINGKNVAVIGHFPFLERIKDICNLMVLERKPSGDDYPDSACEYILPQCDYVFITGVTLINKTLPRLLDICKNAKVHLVGPSVALAP